MAWCHGGTLKDLYLYLYLSFSDGFKMFVHQQWFAQPQGQKRDSYVMHLTDREQIAAVAQLRTGSHWLMIDKGRRLKVEGRWQKLDRSARCCAHCPGRVDDEMHLLECPHWAPLRDRHGLHTFPWGTAGDAVVVVVVTVCSGTHSSAHQTPQ